MHNDSAQLEALLFIHGDPLSLQQIAHALDASHDAVLRTLEALESNLAHDDRGLMLVRAGDTVQLATKPAFHDIAQQFIKAELAEELTPASIETLAIIAYFGPISRARIDYQRGVNSSFILRSLAVRGLIDRASDPVHPQSYLYSPSIELLKHLGVSKQENLPESEKFKSLLKHAEAVGD